MSILRQFSIQNHQSEPKHQHQNFAEREIQDVKRMTNRLMDRTGTPAKYWLLCLLFVGYLLNWLSYPGLNHETPLLAATGQRPDISNLLNYSWWEDVYYLESEAKFPSESREKEGKWVGVAEHKGDNMTYWILTNDTDQVIPRSVIQNALKRTPTSGQMMLLG